MGKHDDLLVCHYCPLSYNVQCQKFNSSKIFWYAMKNLFIVVERYWSKKLTNSAELYEL